MRNLKLSTELTSILELQSENETIQFAAFDIEKNRLFFASSTNFIYTAQLPSIHVYILISVLKFIDFIDVKNTPSLLCCDWEISIYYLTCNV